MNIFKTAMVAAAAAMMISTAAMAGENIGERDLSAGFSLTSYTLQVQAFDDPRVPGVSCHVSDVAVGGLGSVLGDDPSNASISCRQTGQIQIPGATEQQWWGKDSNKNVVSSISMYAQIEK